MNQQTLGQYLFDRRIRLGITGAELARRAGITRSFLSALEAGKRTSISVTTAWKLADALEVDIGSLMLRCRP